MKNITKTIILATAVTAFAVLLLAGCRDGNKRRSAQKEPEFHMPAPIDTSEMDEEFYRRMRELEALHPDTPLDR